MAGVIVVEIVYPELQPAPPVANSGVTDGLNLGQPPLLQLVPGNPRSDLQGYNKPAPTL